MSEGKHYLLSPSASSRWLECPGSLAYAMPDSAHAKPVPANYGNAYSLQGTAAHEIAYDLLEGSDPPEIVKFCNRCNHRVVDVAGCTECGCPEFRIDHDLVDNVMPYVEFVSAIRNTNEILYAADEVELSDPKLADFGGTVDSLTLYRSGIGDVVLMVCDLKYGAGVYVEADGNTQLACYLLLALQEIERLGYPTPDLISGVIVQPRCGPDTIRECYWTAADLLGFRERVLLAYANAASDQPTWQAGDHCRWCPFVTDCPTVQQVTTELAEIDFAGLESATPATTVDLARLADLYSKQKAVDTLFKRVADILTEAIKSGGTVPGYKLVRSIGNRRWKVADDVVIRKLRKFKITDDSGERNIGKKDIVEVKLLSPAKVEKLCKESKAVVAELTEKPAGDIVLAREDDKRPAIEVSTPDQDFERLFHAKLDHTQGTR